MNFSWIGNRWSEGKGRPMKRVVLMCGCRLDGLTPNTPRIRQGANKRKFETPMSKVKAEPKSSPGEFKTPYKPGENGVA